MGRWAREGVRDVPPDTVEAGSWTGAAYDTRGVCAERLWRRARWRRPGSDPEERERRFWGYEWPGRVSPPLRPRSDRGRHLHDEPRRKPYPPDHPPPQGLEGQRTRGGPRWAGG